MEEEGVIYGIHPFFPSHKDDVNKKKAISPDQGQINLH